MGFSSKLVAGDWSQDGCLEILQPKNEGKTQEQQQRRKAAPLSCPRCESDNTKFCYYNNYNKSQPRHFCRACRRHWTNGGTLRNVPVGGGRRNKRLNAVHNTSTSMDNNGIAQHQQQMPLPVPFDDGNGHSSIFPGILHQVLLRPPPPPLPLAAYAMDGSGGLFPVPPFLPEFGTAEADFSSSSDNVINTLSSISSSSCSPPYSCTRLDPTPLPASYLSCWEDISDLVNAQDSIFSTYQ